MKIKNKDVLFEQYKMFVDSAEKTSDKRIAQNNIYLTLNLAFLSFLTTQTGDKTHFIIASIIGIIVCVIWYLTINNYSKRNKVKFDILNQWEEEFNLMYKEEWNRIERITPLTTFEKAISILFIIAYAILIFTTFFTICIK